MKGTIMNVADADRTIRELQAKRETLLARRKAIEAEVRTIGYAVHVDSDRAAKTQLAKLNVEMAQLATDETAIDGALVEAERRQAEAKKTSDAVGAAEKLIELKRLDGELRDLGKRTDAALATVVALVGQRHEVQALMRRLGDSRGGELAGVTDKRCIETVLMRLGRPFEAIEPNMRLTFAEADDRSTPKRRMAA
jgi:hypothetical protein